MRSDFLRSVLAEESRAYGFTIAFWGSGIVLVNSFGFPSLARVLLYGAGAITGFGIISAYAFSRALKTADYETPNFLVASMFHYIAALIPIIVTNTLTALEPAAAFFLSGLNVAALYNILMLFEELLSEYLRSFEERLVDI